LCKENQVEENICCAGLISGEHGLFNWSEHAGTYDFFDMKGDLQALFSELQQSGIQFIPGEHPGLHPGKTAEIRHGSQSIGWLGALHPKLLDEFDLSTEVILFELMISTLQDTPQLTYQPISKYPLIRRDLSLLIDETVDATALETVVREVLDPKMLKECYIFDVYTGGNLAEEQKKSVALGMVLQSNERTLVDADIQAMMADVISALEKKLNAVLRAA